MSTVVIAAKQSQSYPRRTPRARFVSFYCKAALASLPASPGWRRLSCASCSATSGSKRAGPSGTTSTDSRLASSIGACRCPTSAPRRAWTDFVGGGFIMLGLFARLIAISMIINMLVAIVLVVIKNVGGINAFVELNEVVYVLLFSADGRPRQGESGCVNSRAGSASSRRSSKRRAPKHGARRADTVNAAVASEGSCRIEGTRGARSGCGQV